MLPNGEIKERILNLSFGFEADSLNNTKKYLIAVT